MPGGINVLHCLFVLNIYKGDTVSLITIFISNPQLNLGTSQYHRSSIRCIVFYIGGELNLIELPQLW